jgi:prepilin-type N-terminal cleavage/methylation domain-containing protein
MYDRWHRPAQSGFSLLELTVVLGIIAVLAGIGVQAYQGVTERAQLDLARTEMNEIATAIQRFHADTGYWPKEGPFEDDDSINKACFVDVNGTVIDDHPALLAQLRTQPFHRTSDLDSSCDFNRPVLEYDQASGTGWNGPYVRELDAASVVVGVMSKDGTGNPATGTILSGTAFRVSGLGDTFNEDATAAGVFAWTDTAGNALAQLGRPYLYFFTRDPTDSDSNGNPDYDNDDDGELDAVSGCVMPCLVSMGPNGIYVDPLSDEDNIVINIAGN